MDVGSTTINEYLPEEILAYVFSLTDFSTLGNISKVCRLWNRVVNEGWKLYLAETVPNLYHHYMDNRAVSRVFPSWSRFAAKNLYLEPLRLHMVHFQLESCPKNRLEKLKIIDNHIVAIASGAIFVWDLKDFSLRGRLAMEMGQTVSSFTIAGRWLICGTLQGELIGYDLVENRKTVTHQLGRGFIGSVIGWKDVVIVGCGNGSIIQIAPSDPTKEACLVSRLNCSEESFILLKEKCFQPEVNGSFDLTTSALCRLISCLPKDQEEAWKGISAMDLYREEVICGTLDGKLFGFRPSDTNTKWSVKLCSSPILAISCFHLKVHAFHHDGTLSTFDLTKRRLSSQETQVQQRPYYFRSLGAFHLVGKVHSATKVLSHELAKGRAVHSAALPFVFGLDSVSEKVYTFNGQCVGVWSYGLENGICELPAPFSSYVMLLRYSKEMIYTLHHGAQETYSLYATSVSEKESRLISNAVDRGKFFSSEGELFFYQEGDLYQVSEGGVVRKRVEGKDIRHLAVHEGCVYALVRTLNGDVIYSFPKSLQSGQGFDTISCPKLKPVLDDIYTKMVASPPYLFFASVSGVKIYHMETGELSHPTLQYPSNMLCAKNGWIYTFTGSPKEKRYQGIAVIEASTGEVMTKKFIHLPYQISDIQIKEDKIFALEHGKAVHVVDSKTRRYIKSFENRGLHGDSIYAFHVEEDVLYTGHVNGKITVWNGVGV